MLKKRNPCTQTRFRMLLYLLVSQHRSAIFSRKEMERLHVGYQITITNSLPVQKNSLRTNPGVYQAVTYL